MEVLQHLQVLGDSHSIKGMVVPPFYTPSQFYIGLHHQHNSKSHTGAQVIFKGASRKEKPYLCLFEAPVLSQAYLFVGERGRITKQKEQGLCSQTSLGLNPSSTPLQLKDFG